MNVRKALYFSYHRLTGSSFPAIYEELVRQDRCGVAPDTTQQLLVQLLTHCQRSVPYYAATMKKIGGSFEDDPEAYLLKLPILTKERIRQDFEQFKSLDLKQRKWYFNTSGGSTGEPVKLIQDRAYKDREFAIAQYYSTWLGGEVGDPEVYIWGSTRDILGGNLREKMRIWMANNLLRRTVLNAFYMPPEKMREFVAMLNSKRPKLIIAYVESIYELARFIEREQLAICPQSAIIVSAGSLYPFMRETIESVFQCKVFDRYGSREVGGIAGECAVHKGLHVFPWGNYVEIVDEAGRRLPAGVEGNIVVSCLSNFAMPLLRYQIGDRGILSAEASCPCGRHGQILERVSGRTDHVFKTRDGTQVDGGYFTDLLLFRPWVEKFQVIQKSYSSLLFRIKQSGHSYEPEELTDIISKTRVVMDQDCQVDFDFVDDIPTLSSGKYRYTISEVN
ncbi:MAG: phenylacetate--CoA ligase family protein [Ktedonobacteraceae bacterium]